MSNTPQDDDNVKVRCMGCKTDYVTSHESFKKRQCCCPRCDDSRAQLRDLFTP